MHETKPRIGISACLIGQKVRHNGEHKKQDWLVENLAPFVTWVPICPEVEMGLGIPRDTLRLIGKAADPKLIVIRTKEDITDQAVKTAEKLLAKDLDLDAYIFKRDSPSCGLERVKIYGDSGIPMKSAVGIYAQAVKAKYAGIPMIEEGRLTDTPQREAFVIQVFAFFKLKNMNKRISELQKFHQSYKFLLMSLNDTLYRKLGKVAANSDRKDTKAVIQEYRELLVDALNRPSSVGKQVNILQHLLGFLKTKLDSAEKKQVLEVIEDFQNGELPLIVPLTLISHLAKKHAIDYLLHQEVFHPYPKGLKI